MHKTPPEVLLGFDFGMKRIGIAVGQTITKTAQPLETVTSTKGIPPWDKLAQLIKTWQPDALVVGIPLNMDGTPQPITYTAKQFAKDLETRFQLPVFEMDERLSTKDAKDRLFQKGGYKALQRGQIDSIAAQLILQSWLNAS